MLFSDAVLNIFTGVLMWRIVFNIFSMMFAKISLLFFCFGIRLFVPIMFVSFRMVLCETSMLLFVSVWCYANPRCYYSSPYGVMRNLDAIIRLRMVLCKPSICYYSCPYGVLQNLDAIIRLRMVLCETSMLLFVSVWCFANPRCYYSCPYGVLQNLDAIIRLRMVLCETSMLLFVSVWCFANPRCYCSCPYGVMRNLDSIIRLRMMFCKPSMLLFVSV